MTHGQFYCSIAPQIEHSYCFVFFNFTHKKFHTESVHAHRNSKTLTRCYHFSAMISCKINNLVFVSMKTPFQYQFCTVGAIHLG